MLWPKGKSVAQNIDAILFDTDAPLGDDFAGLVNHDWPSALTFS